MRRENAKAKVITAMGTWMTIAAAVAAALAYFTARFLDSRRQLRMLQKADLVSNSQCKSARSIGRTLLTVSFVLSPCQMLIPSLAICSF